MPRPTQIYFPGFEGLGIKEFGGALIKGNPRQARPMALKRPIHLVMRSSAAKGSWSFLHRSRASIIRRLVYRLARSSGVRVYRFANSGNHLHLMIQTPSRQAFHSYIRSLTGLIARLTTQIQKGQILGQRFWDSRPYTRIIEWGREFQIVAAYLQQNTLKALGFIPYQPRRKSGLAPPSSVLLA